MITDPLTKCYFCQQTTSKISNEFSSSEILKSCPSCEKEHNLLLVRMAIRQFNVNGKPTPEVINIKVPGPNYQVMDNIRAFEMGEKEHSIYGTAYYVHSRLENDYQWTTSISVEIDGEYRKGNSIIFKGNPFTPTNVKEKLSLYILFS